MPVLKLFSSNCLAAYKIIIINNKIKIIKQQQQQNNIFLFVVAINIVIGRKKI